MEISFIAGDGKKWIVTHMEMHEDNVWQATAFEDAGDGMVQPSTMIRTQGSSSDEALTNLRNAVERSVERVARQAMDIDQQEVG